ncbi:uncharacterized protein LOC124367784 [Homalodisca vitripennis]|uniref:uncharacterized protein LOC124367784 n=1 Tax=Homalodisca vitripennis TaxID=197043 RepID=UPI001EE9BC7A|nr:uncharacterized protein LOC124367784 [Homalodisca vitripennis]
MRRVLVGVTVAVVAALVASAVGAPATTGEEAGSGDDTGDVVYDQRQNGSENLRVSVSDVMVLVAPADSLVPMAEGALNSLALGVVGAAVMDKVKAPAPDCSEHGKCKAASLRSRLRLSNLLQPLVNRAHHRK